MPCHCRYSELIDTVIALMANGNTAVQNAWVPLLMVRHASQTHPSTRRAPPPPYPASRSLPDLIFMYDVHVVAEGGFAAVYCYVCWGRAVASAKYATPASARGARGSLPTSPTTGVALPPPSAARGRLGSAPAVPGDSKRASAKLKGARPRPGEVVTVDNPVTQASVTAEVQQVGSGLEAAARRSSTIAV